MPSSAWSLAIDFGTTNTAAAKRDAAGATSVLQIDGMNVIPSVVYLDPDLGLLAGRTAEALAPSAPHRALRSPKRRLIDPARVVLDRRAFTPATVAATVLSHVLERAIASVGSRPDEVVLTHPAAWGRPQLGRFREAAALAGFVDPVLVPEPIAAVTQLATTTSVPPGGHLAVYDLGGGTFDTAVVRAHAISGALRDQVAFELIGRADGDANLGGELFDELIAELLIARLEPDDAEALTTSSDPLWQRANAQLLVEARRIKEAAWTPHALDLLVALPSGFVPVRLERQDIDDAVDPYLEESADSLVRALADNGIDAGRLHGVFLVGGCSQMPRVESVVRERFPTVPLLRVADPKTVVAVGALAAAAVMGDRATRPTFGFGSTDEPGRPGSTAGQASQAGETSIPGLAARPRTAGPQPVAAAPEPRVPNAPALEALAAEAPGSAAPAPPPPVQEAPVQEAPVQEAPVQEAPVQEAPVQEARIAPVVGEPFQVAPPDIGAPLPAPPNFVTPRPGLPFTTAASAGSAPTASSPAPGADAVHAPPFPPAPNPYLAPMPAPSWQGAPTTTKPSSRRRWPAVVGALMILVLGASALALVLARSPDDTASDTTPTDSASDTTPSDTGSDTGSSDGFAPASGGTVEWSADGRIVSRTFSNGTVRLWNPRTGEALCTLEGNSVALSPDGTKAATTSSDEIVRISTTSGELLETIEEAKAFEWSPDGERVAILQADGMIGIGPVDGGPESRKFSQPTPRINGIQWSPNSRQLAVRDVDLTYVFDTAEPDSFKELGGPLAFGEVAWSPDGTRLAGMLEDGSLRIWDSATAEAVATSSPDAKVREKWWAPDSARIALKGDFGDVTLRVVDAATLSEVSTSDAQGLSVAWSPDGSRVVVARFDNTVSVINSSDGTEIVELNTQGSAIEFVSWSPTDDLIITEGDGRIHVWDATKGEIVSALTD